jgi:hypothetical protein
MHRTAQNAADRLRWGNQGLMRAREFDIDKVTSQYLQLYRNILNSRHPQT